MKPNANRERATAAYRVHLREVSTLLLNSMNRVDELNEFPGARNVTWADVGTAKQVREHAVRLARALGLITEAEAKEHGVVL